MVMKNLENSFVTECHRHVMEFCFSVTVIEMSWYFTNMSSKKVIFTKLLFRKLFVFFSSTMM